MASESEWNTIILTSSVSGSVAVAKYTDKVKALFKAKGVLVGEEIDASVEENKERRNALFDISGVRGKFPQVFKWRGEGDGIETVYVGMAEEIMEFNENEDIPAETLQQYPEIKTFSKVFGDCARA